jgi:hypothetical protein
MPRKTRGVGASLKLAQAPGRNAAVQETNVRKKNLTSPAARQGNDRETTNLRQIFYIFSFMIWRAETSCLERAPQPVLIRL